MNQKEFDAHPEYYALIDGKRQGPDVELAHPAVRKMVLDYARQHFKENPKSDMVSIDPVDIPNHSESPESLKLGSYSDRIFGRANEVAQMLQMVVIKKQSRGFLRHEMFKRLNTGGSKIEPQEIPNCSARMVGENGVAFYTFLVELAKTKEFAECAAYLPGAELAKKGDEELVLRYLALKNAQDTFKGSVRDWLDTYMESVLLSSKPFPFDEERVLFQRVFSTARTKLSETAFLRYRDNSPIGSLAPAYFEAVTMALLSTIDASEKKDAAAMRNAVTVAIQSEAFREVTGPGANSKEKLRKRISIMTKALNSA